MRKGIKNIFYWTKKHLWMVFLIIIVNFILQYFYSFLPLFVQYAFKIIGNEDASSVNLPSFIIKIFEISDKPLTIVLTVGISMVALQMIRSVLRYANNYTSVRCLELIATDMKNELYSHLVDLPYSYHNRCDKGDIIQRCTSDVTTSSSFVSRQIPEFVNIFVTIGIGAYQVYHINKIMMLVSLIIIPISGIASICFFRYVNKAFNKVERKEARLTTIINENINNARVVKAFGNEKYEFEKMDQANVEYREEAKRFNKRMAFFWSSMDSMVALQYAATLITGILLAKNNIVDSYDVIASLLLMNMLVWPIRGLGRIISGFGKSIVAANRTHEIIEVDSEFNINGELKPNIIGGIEFKDVSFKFDDENNPTIKNISFKISPGETIAIMGRTGSGKTTIANLLTRMIESSEGEILIDGINIKNIDKKYLRKNIKLVLQSPFLFSKTIYENVSIANKKADIKRIKEACEISNVIDEINSFEKGFDTIVGEKGTTLSGGQVERLSIARALVEDSKILIFDDSLSALDNKTDLLIRRALKERNKNITTIIITHRTTTAYEADKIIVFEKGEVKDIGTHDTLKNKPGLYKDLWEIQGNLLESFNNDLKEGI